MTDYLTLVEVLAINGARWTADARATEAFMLGLYETGEFRFEKLHPWLRHSAQIPDKST